MSIISNQTLFHTRVLIFSGNNSIIIDNTGNNLLKINIQYQEKLFYYKEQNFLSEWT
jgi:hypothetical protein